MSEARARAIQGWPPLVDHQHPRPHGAGAEPVQGLLAGLINGVAPAPTTFRRGAGRGDGCYQEGRGQRTVSLSATQRRSRLAQLVHPPAF
jgi:hypothetical protein